MINKLINYLIEFFYTKKVVTFIALILIIALGIFAHEILDTEAYPEFTPPTVRVITLAPGKGAEEVEKLITIPLEKELNAIPHENSIRSISILGLSVISVIFDDGSVQLQNRQQVLERISQADIPDYARPTLDPDSGGTGEIYRYTLNSKYYNAMSLRTIEDWQLERQFKQIPGVIDVVSFGGPTKNYQINIDAKKLLSYGIQLTTVFDAIQNSNGTTGGNYIENNGRAYIVRGLGLLRNKKDIEQIVVSSTQEGVPVRVGDIGTVNIGPGIRLGQLGKNYDNDAVMGIILMRRGENASKVVQRLYERLPQIKESLPEGIKLEKLYDRQELVQNTLNTVFHNVFEGIGLVVGILIVFLLDIQSGLIASLAIPLSLCLALILLCMCHISANLLSLGAIDFGIIVDGAVVMVENAFAKLSSLDNETTLEERKQIVLDSAKQVGTPILFAITIIMITFLPIFTFEGVAGKLFRPLVFTMNFHLVGAIVSALFIIPCLIGIFLTRRKLRHGESFIIRAIHKVYDPVLKFALNNKKIILLLTLFSFMLTGFIASHVGTEFLPALDEGNIWLRTTVLPTSVSLEESVKIAKKMRDILLKFPEVRNVTSQTGSPDDGTDPNLFSNIELFIDLYPADSWRGQFGQNKQKLIEAFNESLQVIPNINLYFSQYIQDNVDEAVAGAKGSLAIKIYGPDISVLQNLGDRISSIVEKVPGLVDVACNQELGQPQYLIQIDRDQASRYGVNVSDIQNLVEIAVAGKVATNLISDEKRFPVFVRFASKYRNTENALDNILIDPPGPITQVPLSQMASIKYGSGASFITREANSRVMIIRINLRGRDLGSAVLEAQKKIKDNIKIPAGYKLKWAGQYEFQQEANKRLMLIIPATLLLIYLVLLLAFRQHRHAFLILIAIPLAGLGGFTALLVTNTYFSISAAVGFIALAGVTVQNGVILLSYILQIKKSENISSQEAAYKGALDRVRPVVMTATVAMLGLIPAAISNGIGSQSQKPFAIVIIGGLMSATVLTLLILPVLYVIFEDNFKKGISVKKSMLKHTQPLIILMFCSIVLSSCSEGSKLDIVKLQKERLQQANQSVNDENLNINKSQENEIDLKTTTAQLNYINKFVEAPGRVGPNNELSRNVSTPSQGRADKVLARLGDTVHEGQLLAIIRSDAIGQLQSDLLQNVLQAKADIKQQEVQLRLSKITYDREKKLFDEQVSAQADMQAAQTQLEKDQANLQALKSKLSALITTSQERLSLLGAPADSAQKVIQNKKIDPNILIKSPMSGLIIQRNINPGELSDDSKPMFVVTNLSQVWLFADVFEKDIELIKKDDKAEVTIDSIPNKKFEATVIWIGDSINPQTRTLAIRANVNNNDNLLKPGMFARLKIDVGRCLRLVVPENSIVQEGDDSFIFIKRGNNNFERKKIVTGQNDGTLTEIIDGIKNGDVIVSNGATALLGDSMKIQEAK